ncbi:microtubule-destabilizing protein 60-like [Amaranthus tricolor]|uniref:microtubule-destabilizing protein 60-like n=1 Tax=Amaranthus tricolor TaxID=29722 RepID=UPI00258E5BBA|nr:microtubule-destabilizing protein 60-like [Amaranthus tricolor]
MATPTKDAQADRSNVSMKIKNQENSNPNLKTPGGTKLKSPNTQKSATKNPNPTFLSPKKKIRERKFFVAKKNNVKKQESHPNCKCKDKFNGKCLCVAYENLRASQEEFFKSKSVGVEEYEDFGETYVEIPKENNLKSEKTEIQSRNEKCDDESDKRGSNEIGVCKPEMAESPKGIGSSTIKRRRDILMEEARASVPEPGSGRVLHLVKAFEKLLTIPKESQNDKEEGDNKEGIKWALPGLQEPSIDPETKESSSSFCPGELFFNAESLGLDAKVSSSLDSSRDSGSSRSSIGSRRSRRSGSFSSGTVGGRKWKKKQQHRVTSQRPFRLRTEQRGKMKEEEFVKKLQEMMIEEEKQRIPIAQGLPWTTDEPECLIKPTIKECTKPIDLKLHSDVRAVERAEFDHQVAEKLMMIEQYKMERERQQKLEEEEEIRRLRKELVPKAQPMPYFDRPFIPKRSEKQPTIPKDPKFHFPQQKKIKCCLSWNDLNDYIHAPS